jgi:hypothetical protein
VRRRAALAVVLAFVLPLAFPFGIWGDQQAGADQRPGQELQQGAPGRAARHGHGQLIKPLLIHADLPRCCPTDCSDADGPADESHVMSR